MGKFIKHAIGRLPLLIAMLVTAGLATAQTQGLDLSFNREIIDRGDGRLTCQLSCEASVDTVTLESLAIMWLNLDIKASNVHTVSKGGKNLGSFSLDGLTGNGTGDIGNNNGFITLGGLDEDTCTSDQFLCEAAFTGASGVKERAFAASLPQRPQSSRLEKTVEEMSSALEKLNMSYTQLLMDSNKDGEENAKLKTRLEALEKKVSSLLSGPQSCDPCSNVSRAVEELEERLEQLENQSKTENNNNTPDGVSPESVCEKKCFRGMNETCSEPFYIITNDALGREVRCDAQTDGGGWIIFQRRLDGSVGFQRTWADYKSGFGNVSTEFWLGNEALYNLTNTESYEMRVDLKLKQEPNRLYNTYTNIVVESESDKYRLRIGTLREGTLQETLTGGLAYHNNQAFSTKDRDNDNNNLANCAAGDATGPFWNNRCSFVTPNAGWGNAQWNNGVWTLPKDIEFIEMKIRPQASSL